MKYWKKLSHREQDEKITEALHNNIDYKQKISLGVPASRLDPKVFHEHLPMLKDSPLLRSYIQNSNQIGCHTLGQSEPFFQGTQELEYEVIELLAVDLLGAKEQSCDGYIATGGTEANIEAAWIYRNYFMEQFGARQDEIVLLSSADTHYSVAKAANLLNIASYVVPVDDVTRAIHPKALDETIKRAKGNGARYFIVISNMATTMFGSVDDPDVYASILENNGVEYRIHIDGAFGGFVYPISHPHSHINFGNPNISSFTLDAHKMLQAPYGTGIFIVRKGLIEYVTTREARYVNGMDITVSGSRSATNAIAVWMILFTYGPYGWLEKINKLLYRTDWLCKGLDDAGIEYYRHPAMNIVAIRAQYIPGPLAEKFGLVPDTYEADSKWYKIVVMDHVLFEHLEAFMEELTASRAVQMG